MSVKKIKIIGSIAAILITLAIYIFPAEIYNQKRWHRIDVFVEFFAVLLSDKTTEGSFESRDEKRKFYSKCRNYLLCLCSFFNMHFMYADYWLILFKNHIMTERCIAMVFTHLITACATEKQTALLSVAFTQLADTLATIAVVNELQETNQNIEKNNDCWKRRAYMRAFFIYMKGCDFCQEDIINCCPRFGFYS